MSRPLQVASWSRSLKTAPFGRYALPLRSSRLPQRPDTCIRPNAILGRRAISFVKARPDDNAQRVRFLSKSRLGSYAAYSLAAALFANALIKSAIRSLDDQPEESTDDEDDADIEVVKDTDGKNVVIRKLLVIPLSWPKAVSKTFYKGSDVEWQAFVKLGENGEQKQALIKALVDKIAHRLTDDRRLMGLIGGRKQIDLGHYMLDITFPYGPPQEYERMILLFHDTGIATATQGVSNEYYTHLARVMWPTDTFNAVKTFFRILTNYHWLEIKEGLGYGAKQGTKEYKLHQFAKNIEANAKKQQDGPAHAFRAEGNRHVKLRNRSADDSTTRDDDAGSPARWLPPFSTSLAVQAKIALGAALTVMRQSGRKIPKEPPRGQVLVTGMIEATGQRGSATFYVRAYCDPETGHCDHLALQVSSFKEWVQKPRGGQ